MASAFVGRAVLGSDEYGPLVNFTAVATYAPESDALRKFVKARVEVAEGSAPPGDLRAIVMGLENVNGRQLPWLAEVPVGERP